MGEMSDDDKKHLPTIISVSVGLYLALIGAVAGLYQQIGQLEQSLTVSIDRHEEFVSVEHGAQTAAIVHQGELTRGKTTTAIDDINFRIGYYTGLGCSVPE